MIQVIADLLIALAGIGVGRYVIPRHRIRRDPKPVCGCTHDVSFHRGHTGECHYHSSYTGTCRCQKYSGPVPLPEYYAKELQ